MLWRKTKPRKGGECRAEQFDVRGTGTPTERATHRQGSEMRGVPCAWQNVPEKGIAVTRPCRQCLRTPRRPVRLTSWVTETGVRKGAGWAAGATTSGQQATARLRCPPRDTEPWARG